MSNTAKEARNTPDNAGTESTLVSTPAEPSPEATSNAGATAADEDPDGLRDGITRFEGTISKVNKDGDVVLSDHIGPGERRVSDTPENKNA